MATGIYVRVSSRAQDLRSQLPDLEAWAKAAEGNGETVQWFRDKFTGKDFANRDGFNQLMSRIMAGKITRLVCWRLDRLGRTTSGLVNLLDELVARKVGFVSLREGFDIATPAGRMMYGVLSSVAAYEIEVKKERQLAGIE